MEKFYVKKIFELSKDALFPSETEFIDYSVRYGDKAIKDASGTVVEVADIKIDYLFELGEKFKEEYNKFSILVDDISFWIKFVKHKPDNSVNVSYGFDASTIFNGTFNVTKNQLFILEDLTNNNIKDTEFYDFFVRDSKVFTNLIKTSDSDSIFTAVYNVLETILTSSVEYLIESITVMEDKKEDSVVIDLRKSKSKEIIIKLKDKEIIIKNNNLEEI